jgi:hypothetical protein
MVLPFPSQGYNRSFKLVLDSTKHTQIHMVLPPRVGGESPCQRVKYVLCCAQLHVDVVIGVVSPATGRTFVSFTVSDSVEAERAHLQPNDIGQSSGYLIREEWKDMRRCGATNGKCVAHSIFIIATSVALQQGQTSDLRRPKELNSTVMRAMTVPGSHKGRV